MTACCTVVGVRVAPFDFDIPASYRVAHRFRPLLDRLFSHFSHLDHNVVFAFGICKGSVDGAPIYVDALLSQLHGLLDRPLLCTSINTYPPGLHGSLTDHLFLLGNRDGSGVLVSSRVGAV